MTRARKCGRFATRPRPWCSEPGDGIETRHSEWPRFGPGVPGLRSAIPEVHRQALVPTGGAPRLCACADQFDIGNSLVPAPMTTDERGRRLGERLCQRVRGRGTSEEPFFTRTRRAIE